MNGFRLITNFLANQMIKKLSTYSFSTKFSEKPTVGKHPKAIQYIKMI